MLYVGFPIPCSGFLARLGLFRFSFDPSLGLGCAPFGVFLGALQFDLAALGVQTGAFGIGPYP